MYGVIMKIVLSVFCVKNMFCDEALLDDLSYLCR